MNDNPICDIVVPIWNQPERTHRCLESVTASGERGIHFLLVDNGSLPPTRELLDRFQKESSFPVQVIRNETNLGFIKAVNQGIRAGSAPWICLLNNDTVVTAGWLTEMIQVASQPKVGLVNPTSNSLGFHAGTIPLEEYAAGLKPESGRWTELTTALGFCLLARRSLFDQVGLLEEAFGMGNFDDDDLSRRVKGMGLLCVRACAAYVYHEEKVSFRELPDWEKNFEKNKHLFEERWGKNLRILWGRADLSEKGNWEGLAVNLARQGHWICFVSPQDLPPKLLSQAQISRLPAGPRSWRWAATLRLLIKRKKPFQLVISDDPRWSHWLKALQWLHGAALLSSPTESEIETLCKNLSHSRS